MLSVTHYPWELLNLKGTNHAAGGNVPPPTRSM